MKVRVFEKNVFCKIVFNKFIEIGSDDFWTWMFQCRDDFLHGQKVRRKWVQCSRILYFPLLSSWHELDVIEDVPDGLAVERELKNVWYIRWFDCYKETDRVVDVVQESVSCLRLGITVRIWLNYDDKHPTHRGHRGLNGKCKHEQSFRREYKKGRRNSSTLIQNGPRQQTIRRVDNRNLYSANQPDIFV